MGLLSLDLIMQLFVNVTVEDGPLAREDKGALLKWGKAPPPVGSAPPPQSPPQFGPLQPMSLEEVNLMWVGRRVAGQGPY